MKKLLFLAPYPTKENEKEGMMSRIKCIDKLFEKEARTYLNIFIRNQIDEKYEKENVCVYNLNLFKNIILIFKILFSSNFIYCHSLYSLRFIWPILLFKIKCKLVLDIHGVIPDEKKFCKQYFSSFCFRLIERIVFHKIDYAICVTNAMKQVYEKRYKFARCNYLVYSILPVELFHTQFSLNESMNSNDIVEIIYSGGIQKWQNIDLMLNAISQNLSDKVHYTILTANVDEVKEKARELNIDNKKMEITTCPSSELEKFYTKANYAFILRDPSIVNQVANPTKLVEYLFYGLIPIVLSPSIGDYLNLGYEYINLSDFNSNNVSPRKSKINQSIALQLLKQNTEMNLATLLLKK